MKAKRTFTRRSGLGWPAAVAALLALGAGPAGLWAGTTWEMAGAATLAAWQEADPAETLYRSGREALVSGDLTTAVERFQRLVTAHPESERAGDALYWEAFARYRLGGEAELERALRALDRQANEYPEAGTREDARALSARIRGELARSGDARAAAEVAAQAAAGAEAGGCEEDELRSAALNALLQMDAERAMPILRRVLVRRDDCSASLRRRAVFLVAQKGGEEAGEVLVEAARSDPDPEVRGQAVFWLSQVPGEGSVQLLTEILRTTQDPNLEERALFALAQHRHAAAADVLRRHAADPDRPDRMRERAIFWLGQQGHEQGEFLRELYGDVESDALRERILFALAQTGDPASMEWLLERAADGGAPIELRKKALFWAGQGGAPIERLAALYDAAEGREMKEQLIFVYAQRSEPAATDRLISIARNEEDPELRKRAIFWLGQSDDPRAADVLLEVIDP